MDVITTPQIETERARALLKALSDHLRLQVIEALAGGESCVCDLATQLVLGCCGRSPTTSQAHNHHPPQTNQMRLTKTRSLVPLLGQGALSLGGLHRPLPARGA